MTEPPVVETPAETISIPRPPSVIPVIEIAASAELTLVEESARRTPSDVLPTPAVPMMVRLAAPAPELTDAVLASSTPWLSVPVSPPVPVREMSPDVVEIEASFTSIPMKFPLAPPAFAMSVISPESV